MACTVDCLTTYGCNEIMMAQDGAVYAPFVELRFGKQGQILTVGNSSSPPDNHAAIKSFDYGFSVGTTGLGCKVEIIDEGGITYRKIMDAINKTTHLSYDDTLNCTVRFGWVVKNCDGSSRIVTNEDSGEKLFFNPLKLDTQFEGGTVKCIFEGGSLVSRWCEAHLTATIGSDDNKVRLKDALRKLFTEYDPKVRDVQFKNRDGGELCFKNSDGDCDGPLGKWPTDQQNALACARKWLAGLTTINDLGILMLYDPTGPRIIFKENPENTDCCEGSLGTYIVNGGNCSPVLSFTPQATWVKSGVPAGGGSPPGAASGDANEMVKPTIKIERVGPQTGPPIQQHEWMWRVPDEMGKKNADAVAAAIEANSRYESRQEPMSGELKIIGRPDLGDPEKLIGKSIAIVVINPFYISRENCSWITTSNCNKVLSNKKWQVGQVSHQITGGTYITTIKVSLPGPNITIPASDPLGGPGCGTETFQNSQAGKANGT